MIPRLFVAALALAVLPATPAPAQTIEAPAQIVAGDPVPVRITGLPLRAEVELRVERQTNMPLRSIARFRTDRRGTIDLKRDAPLSGSYSGRDPAGPFWSMARAESAGLTPADGLRLTVAQAGSTLATTNVKVLPAEPGLVVTPVEGFAGATLHQPPGAAAGKRPVVILLGGSEGGDGGGRSLVPLVTRLGYAALVLPYYAPSWVATPAMAGLPGDFADIPVDRLQGVRDWIATQPGLDATRIAIMGTSKGAEFALLAASRFAWPRAIVGIVPIDVVWEGWGPGVPKEGTRSSFAWNGEPLPFVPYVGMADAIAAMTRGEPVPLAPVHVAGRRAHPDRVAAATIPVERYKGPMMVVGGGRDSLWPSAKMARAIGERRRAAGLETLVLTYDGAGHGLSGSGWSPIWAGDGENAAATARAQADTRPRVERFLAEALGEK